jgi:hypothetical protein
MMLACWLTTIYHSSIRHAIPCHAFPLLIRILIRIRIIDILILAIIKVLLSIIIIVTLLRVGRRSRPIILLINRIGFIVVEILVFVLGLFVCLFFCAGFCFVCAFLLRLDEALDLREARYFCDAEGAALLGGLPVGAGAGEGWAEFRGEEVDDCCVGLVWGFWTVWRLFMETYRRVAHLALVVSGALLGIWQSRFGCR